MSRWADIIEAVTILGQIDEWPDGAEHDVICIGGPSPDEVNPKYIKVEGEEHGYDDEDPHTALLGRDGRELGVFWGTEYETWTCYV